MVFPSLSLGITSAGTKKGELFLADVNTQLKNKNVTTDIKVDTNSNLFTTITIDEPAPGLKTIFSFRVPDQRSGKIELQYLHEYAGISLSIGLTANPVVNFSGVLGTKVLALGTDISFDTDWEFHQMQCWIEFHQCGSHCFSGSVTHSFSANVNTVTVGTQHALDPLTTVKARVNNVGKASALIQHEWRPKSLFTISGEVDTKSIDKSPKVGLALAFKP
ncbi:Mitochondrial outer membrane protein porin of 36 kDa [Hibiscus syriacus]|uniref:Mitochondrial outer membrane protein porin of 36 kDa n=1 Tax=Hibiscus syriacus TaxID=106335 RepID=A0A6A3ASI4_HIBSY|nr:Mitochondrial outer membrane protein porin of 36 kDa [Hibiscus syriacus]